MMIGQHFTVSFVFGNFCGFVLNCFEFSLVQKVFLPWEPIIPDDPVRGPTIIGILVFFSYAIVANTVVPISLYVSVEVSSDFRENKSPLRRKMMMMLMKTFF